MAQRRSLEDVIEACRGETWAVAYAFEMPKRPRGLWYDRWRYDVINDYLHAVSLLGAEPYVVDIDGFCRSAMLANNEFDFVVNLNSGATPISNLGLVPSLAQWHETPCFPNSADTILVGERKDVCKKIFVHWFQTPKDLSRAQAVAGDSPFICKPKTMGNSRGVSRTLSAEPDSDMIIEEFIDGYEVTVPVFYDVERADYVVAPPIAYFPNIERPREWHMAHEQKMMHLIDVERRILKLSERFRDALLDASRFFQFQTIARFDFRWRSPDPPPQVIPLEEIWFLEINCLPTLKSNVNFIKSISAYLAENPCSAIDVRCADAAADIRALAYLLAQARGKATTR